MSATRRFPRGLAWALVFFLGTAVGIAYERVERSPSAPGDLLGVIERVFTRPSTGASPGVLPGVLEKIQQEYVEQAVDETTLYYGATAGVVEALNDPYSSFFDPETTERFKADLGEATFGGIGAEIGAEEEAVVVIAPLPDSPAERAGVLAGDRIIQVNDTDTTQSTVDEVVALIRGPRGSEVRLTVVRGTTEPKVITITREQIRIESVRWELRQTPTKQPVAYVRFSHFTDETAALFQKAITEFLLKEPVSVVIDLRNNPGGYLQAAVDVAGEFLDEGSPVVSEKRRSGDPIVQQSAGTPDLKGRRIIVLVNGGTASASEILAGALQDYGVATVIGETTFGKGSVQTLDEFPDGSSLKLTVARWFTPKGRSIHGEGITPDQTVADEPADGKDPVLDKALQASDTQP